MKNYIAVVTVSFLSFIGSYVAVNKLIDDHLNNLEKYYSQRETRIKQINQTGIANFQSETE